MELPGLVTLHTMEVQLDGSVGVEGGDVVEALHVGWVCAGVTWWQHGADAITVIQVDLPWTHRRCKHMAIYDASQLDANMPCYNPEY